MAASSTPVNDKIISKAFVVREANGLFEVLDLPRRSLNSNDVLIRILYCAICHGDIHGVKNEWNNSQFPMVPGHEIAGVVEKLGAQVTKLKVGDHVGVGFIVDSCRQCQQCQNDLEQYCTENSAGTFNSTEMDKKTPTYGGYSNFIVVVEHFVSKIPENLPLDRAAPLLCAGITIYSALRQHNTGKNTKIGIIGLGGLGHLAVKFGVALGAAVSVISTSESKRGDAIKLGAKQFILSTDLEQLNTTADTFDIIIDTVSAKHDISHILSTLRFQGTFCVVGAPPAQLEISPFFLIKKRPIITGSFIGGMKETQEMLDFCGRYNITCDVELIQASPENLAMAFERTINSDIKYRFVIDMQNTFK